MSTPQRERALRDLPSPLREDALQRYDWVRTQSGVDETSIVTFEIERASPETEAGVLLRRQVWWFEEETLRWVLDESNEWWLPPDDTAGLLRALARHTSAP